MLTTTLSEARQTGIYEISVDDSHGHWPLLRLPSTYFERASDTRIPGELRQGDRVRLLTDIQGNDDSYESGEVCTVLNTRTQPDGIFHDVLPDYGEVLMALPREQLEEIWGCSADVIYTVHGESVSISFNDTSFNYGEGD
jgi:hypothetical protein